MTAWLALRDGDHYRRNAFAQGLSALGYTVRSGLPRPAARGDVLVIWNRYSPGHEAAAEIERLGGTVLVAENGYLGRTWRGEDWFALARSYHNGAGRWPEGGAERWDRAGQTLAPWRAGGEHILVLPQRGIGPPGVAMPRSWPDEIVAKLRRRTNRRIVVRPHPGRHVATQPLEAALAGAWCVVTWGSGAGVKAIANGVPAFHGLPRWIAAPAARPIAHDIEDPFLGDRLPMFRRLAWAQWRIDEIASGAAFLQHLSATLQAQGDRRLSGVR